MKKLFIFAIALMMLFSLSSVAFAEKQHKNILFNSVFIMEEKPLITSLSLENRNKDTDLRNGRVVVSIPELGLRASGSVDIDEDSRKTKRVTLPIPEDVVEGEYYVRIVVSNKDGKQVKYRLITI
tara:strand:+ start:1871 stop:2245 length:375 start_codon:yes stop_codon:yes gene_type:complete